MMQIITDHVDISTQGHTDIIDITSQVKEVLSNSRLKEGQLTVFVSGAGMHYHHDATWGDGNGSAHVRAALIGGSFTIPFHDGRMLLGTWQQIVVMDFDNRPRNRKIVVQMMGE
jgi:thiamine phosphate synthase YjbQ (UPF0047 family)